MNSGLVVAFTFAAVEGAVLVDSAASAVALAADCGASGAFSSGSCARAFVDVSAKIIPITTESVLAM
jgi:hypothetical protein